MVDELNQDVLHNMSIMNSFVNINQDVLHITPTTEELIPNKHIVCPEANCWSAFSNPANLQMHLTKHHHKLEVRSISKETNTKFFYCPQVDCIYNRQTKNSKRFKCLKYLRQHYIKVHAAKDFKCSKCDKRFSTAGLRNSHETICGKKYDCDACGWSYKSREALLTHSKRKNHSIIPDQIKTGKVRISRSVNPVVVPQSVQYSKLKPVILTPVNILLNSCKTTKEQEIQTEPVEENQDFAPQLVTQSYQQVKRLKSEKTQTTNSIKSVEIQTAFQSVPSSSKPQKKDASTDCNKKSTLDFDLYEDDDSPPVPEIGSNNLNNLNYVEDSCFEQLVNSSSLCDIETQTEFASNILDQLLYSHTHTQTCEEFLSEFGLADIQTQTHWPHVQFDTPASNGNLSELVQDDYNDLLVSTETQTSFTQCLLESTGSHVGGNSSSATTQHTQTCDTLLEGLFGGQGSDLIASFQSAYTQT